MEKKALMGKDPRGARANDPARPHCIEGDLCPNASSSPGLYRAREADKTRLRSEREICHSEDLLYIICIIITGL